MKKYILYIPLLLVILCSCTKNEHDSTYNDIDRIGLSSTANGLTGADSISYTFATSPTGTTESQIAVYATVMGNLTDRDRTFSVAVDEQLTTANADEYTLPDSFVIKAGTAYTMLPVILKRSERLASSSTQLVLKVVSTSDFDLAPKNVFKISWTDELFMPDIWYTFEYLWGRYSAAKYRLMLDATDLKDFSTLSTQDMTTVIYLTSKAREALNEYNAAHPDAPLSSEDGLAIGICSGCN